MIACPTCGGDSAVKETRSRDELRRRRKCKECGASFWSVEIRADEYDRMKGLLDAVTKFTTTQGPTR